MAKDTPVPRTGETHPHPPLPRPNPRWWSNPPRRRSPIGACRGRSASSLWSPCSSPATSSATPPVRTAVVAWGRAGSSSTVIVPGASRWADMPYDMPA